VLESPVEEAAEFASALRDLKRDAKECRQCYNISGEEICRICRDRSRDESTICVVETYQDLTAIERTGAYRGLYHVLRGHLAPLEGKGPEHLTIQRLLERVRRGNVREVILATNPNVEGDSTAMFLARELARSNVKITRIARGIQAGGSVKQSGKSILLDALEGRTKL
jgi:recombination protein RecR